MREQLTFFQLYHERTSYIFPAISCENKLHFDSMTKMMTTLPKTKKHSLSDFYEANSIFLHIKSLFSSVERGRGHTLV
jgi:hypothetical protein